MTRIFTLPEVLNLTRLSRSKLYQLLESDDFPRPLKLGERKNGWTDRQSEKWIAEREAAAEADAERENA